MVLEADKNISIPSYRNASALKYIESLSIFVQKHKTNHGPILNFPLIDMHTARQTGRQSEKLLLSNVVLLEKKAVIAVIKVIQNKFFCPNNTPKFSSN